ncbi:MAG TPA: glycosyltransferase family 2 protein [Bryobacteraceae bacterium]|nr:glycosyltransferase family 2 protein [Bryobacteraceae bacterium]
MTRVAIVIVTYHSAAEIGGCLDALRNETDVEIVVVDNASTDGTREAVLARGIRLIANPTNCGFAGGVNIGVKATTAPLILLLNPDAHLQCGLGEMAAMFDADEKMGIVGGRLTGPDGQPQVGFMTRNLPTPAALSFEVLGINRLWPGNPVNWHYRCMEVSPMIAGPTEQPAGAFFMFSRRVWDTVGGMDERFAPVWFEDVDFCARVKGAGFGIFYQPTAVARHAGGHSISSIPARVRHNYWYGNLLEYAAKHFGIIGFRVVCAATALGSCLRAVRGWPQSSPTVLSEYGAVVRLAFVRLFSVRRGYRGVVSGQHGVDVVTKINCGAGPRKHVR